MRIKDYDCDIPTKSLKKAVTWLNKNKSRLKKERSDYFDFPNYWDMPKNISCRLNEPEVDWLVCQTSNWLDLKLQNKHVLKEAAIKLLHKQVRLAEKMLVDAGLDRKTAKKIAERSLRLALSIQEIKES